MHRIGGAEQLQRRAHADAAVLTFDRSCADHELVVGARDDVERLARMDQPPRTRQRDLVALDDHHLALDAALSGLRLPPRSTPSPDTALFRSRRTSPAAKLAHSPGRSAARLGVPVVWARECE